MPVRVPAALDACLVLGADGRVRTIALFRSRDEDGGFYTVDVLEVPDGLMMVYESGVCLIDEEGNPRWHLRKCWDDVLVSVDDAEARFLEGYDAAFSIDLRTGQRSVQARGGGADE